MTEHSIQTIIHHNQHLYDAEYAVATKPFPLEETKETAAQREQIQQKLRVEIAALRDRALPWPGMPETPTHDPELVCLFEIQARKPPAQAQRIREILNQMTAESHLLLEKF